MLLNYITQGWEHLLFLTTIAIGTPPQSFTAAIDIAWTDLFVPSSRCEQCHNIWSSYNASESSTFVANGSKIALHYAGLYTSGIVSQDTIHLGNLSIKAQQFEEALELRPAPGYWGNIFDGVLGLAPPTASGTHNLLHPLSTVISRGLLDKNIFALQLPSDDKMGGELTLGGINEDSYIGDFVTIPTTSETDPWLQGKWTVEARSAWLGDGDVVKRNLSGFTAFFDSGYPFIDLPRSLAVDALEQIDAKPGNSFFLTVPCSKRNELPDFTFQLHDANITLTAFNYTIEEDGACAVMIDGHQEHGSGKPYVRLGSSFLNAFYSVFDIDKKTVGCKFAINVRPTRRKVHG